MRTITLGRAICLLDLLRILSLLRNSPIDTLRIMFGQLSGHHVVQSSWHKINRDLCSQSTDEPHEHVLTSCICNMFSSFAISLYKLCPLNKITFFLLYDCYHPIYSENPFHSYIIVKISWIDIGKINFLTLCLSIKLFFVLATWNIMTIWQIHSLSS